MKRRCPTVAELEAKLRKELVSTLSIAARWQRAGETEDSRFLVGHAEGAAYAAAGVLFALEGADYVGHAAQQARTVELLRTARAELEAKEVEQRERAGASS